MFDRSTDGSNVWLFHHDRHDSLCSVMNELAALIGKEGAPAYAKVRDRLSHVADKANGVGWGYGDHINGAVNELEAEYE